MEITPKQLKDLPKIKSVKMIFQWKKLKIPGFIVKSNPFKDGNETTIILSCNDVVNMKTGKINIYASSDKPSNTCLGMSVKNNKSIIRVVSKDGCGTETITGTNIMEIIHEINKVFGIKKSWLDDHSHITIGGYSVRLAILSLIKYSKTWYEKNGYKLTKKGYAAKKKFTTLSTNNVIDFLNKCQTIQPANNKFSKQIHEDLKNLIPTFLDKKYYNKSFQKTLRNIIKEDIKNILWFDFIFKLPNPFQFGIGKQLYSLQENLVRHNWTG